MQKKYYWPTSWDNIGLVLSNEFIIPEEIYSKILPEGISINLSRYSTNSSTLTLFSEIPVVEVSTVEGQVAYPAIFEINESCLKPENLKQGDHNTYIYTNAIYFCPKDIKIIFFSDEAKKRTLARLKASSDVKFVDIYSKNFSVKSPSSKKKQEFLINSQEVSLPCSGDLDIIVQDVNKIDSLKGLYVGILLGVFAQKSDIELEMINGIQEILNKVSGLRSDRVINQRLAKDSRLISYAGQEKDDILYILNRIEKNLEANQIIGTGRHGILEKFLRIFLARTYGDKSNTRLKTRLKFYSDFSKKFDVITPLESRAIDYFLTNPLEWQYQDDIEKDPNSLIDLRDILGKDYLKGPEEEASLIFDTEPIFILQKLRKMVDMLSTVSYQANKSSVEFLNLIESLKNYIVNYFETQKVENAHSYLDNTEECDASLGYCNSLWLKEQCKEEYPIWVAIISILLKEAALRTKLEFKNKGWQYEARIKLIEDLYNKVSKENKQLQDELLIIKKALETNFEGSHKVEDLKMDVLKNLYAFLFKYKDIEQLGRYLDQKQIQKPFYAHSFWCLLHGYSGVSNKKCQHIVDRLSVKDQNQLLGNIKRISQL